MAVHETGYGGQHGFPSGLESIPEYIHTLTLPEGVLLLECNIKCKQPLAFLVSETHCEVVDMASLFPHLRVTPYLTPNSQPMKDDDYVREAKKAFYSVTKVWKRVHTIQLEDRPWAIELFGRWRGDQVMGMAKKTLQSNLALEENQDVVAGEIKIWQPSLHRLREVISVTQYLKASFGLLPQPCVGKVFLYGHDNNICARTATVDARRGHSEGPQQLATTTVFVLALGPPEGALIVHRIQARCRKGTLQATFFIRYFRKDTLGWGRQVSLATVTLCRIRLLELTVTLRIMAPFASRMPFNRTREEISYCASPPLYLYDAANASVIPHASQPSRRSDCHLGWMRFAG
ncbi:hypothetical protein BDZ89DRAFT_1237798 [Hymenopellis radicata]|nr:hypothetical protein BDZ89DRAFT_1237798 [Hymenopellis radicata]